jgi:nitrogen fixation/metabolism regulation signal transduction histidine kinase
VIIFGSLVVAPLLIVYLSSLQFLNRGIDSWFRVEVRQGLKDALVLSREALDLRVEECSRRTELLARALTERSGMEIQSRIDEERRATAASEIVLFGGDERILAASLDNPLATVPFAPPADLVRRVSEHRPYVSLEPQPGGQYVIRIGAPLSESPDSPDDRYVMALYPVPTQLADLADTVQRSYSQYGNLAALREPLKYSFSLTLTLVLLLAMLAAFYGAIFSAQRLARPVQDLIAGTRRDGISGAFLQRYDQAPAARARGGDPQPEGRRARAGASGDHPGPAVHRCAGGGSDAHRAHRQRGRGRDTGYRPLRGDRPLPA